MTGPLKSLARHSYLRKHAAKREGRESVSLADISTAVVFIDGTMQGTVKLIDSIHAFFSKAGIKASIYALLFDSKKPYSNKEINAFFLGNRDINWYGRIKTSKAPADGDLFISLLSEEHFAIECAARCSDATIKIGCSKESGDAFDILVSGFGGLSQSEVFAEVAGLIQKIK